MNIDKVKGKLAQRAPFQAAEKPAVFANVPENQIVDLDVRDDLRTGNEPFGKIMGAQATVAQGGVLRLRAIFEPIPLYGVLGKQGFSHWTEKLADDDWRVWFYRGDVATAAAPKQPSYGTNVSEDDLIVLDVRGLEPPEPMTRTLEALQTLPADKSLLQINARVPQFLIPMLDERGFEYVIVREEPNEVRGLIRRKTSQTEKQLDVRVIPPREKHPAIFQTFDALTVGGHFILINDHDPFPLRYQFEAERTNRFTWDYLEKGPVVWRVKIGKIA